MKRTSVTQDTVSGLGKKVFFSHCSELRENILAREYEEICIEIILHKLTFRTVGQSLQGGRPCYNKENNVFKDGIGVKGLRFPSYYSQKMARKYWQFMFTLFTIPCDINSNFQRQ